MSLPEPRAARRLLAAGLIAGTPASGAAVQLRIDDTVGDVLAHPAFAGFGRLLLPWDDRRYEPTMRLREIGSLLPYHTHVASVMASLTASLTASLMRSPARLDDGHEAVDLGTREHLPRAGWPLHFDPRDLCRGAETKMHAGVG